jgi:hypothetical protein
MVENGATVNPRTDQVADGGNPVRELIGFRVPKHDNRNPVYCYSCRIEFKTHKEFRVHVRLDHDFASMAWEH